MLCAYRIPDERAEVQAGAMACSLGAKSVVVGHARKVPLVSMINQLVFERQSHTGYQHIIKGGPLILPINVIILAHIYCRKLATAGL